MDLPSIMKKGFSGNGEASIIIFFFYNHDANRAAMRHFVSILGGPPDVFLCSIVCFAHVLSNSAKWGLIIFPVCDIRRIAHFYRCRPIKNTDSFLSKMLTGALVNESHFP